MTAEYIRTEIRPEYSPETHLRVVVTGLWQGENPQQAGRFMILQTMGSAELSKEAMILPE